MKMQRDLLGTMICMALMGAIGSFLFICAIADIDISKLGAGSVLGFIVGFSGMIFSLLLLWNLNRLQK